MIKYNNSSTGKKFVRVSPDLTAESMKIAEELMKNNASKFQELFTSK